MAPRKKALNGTTLSLRGQLRQKRAMESSFKVFVGEDSAARSNELGEALQAAKLAPFLKNVDEERQAALQAKADKLQEAYDAECVTIRFRGLSPLEWNDLQSEFELPELSAEQRAELEAEGALPKFDLDGYTAALLAASAIDSDLSIDDWREEIESTRWSKAEVDAMRATARSATLGEPAVGLPKG